jgi:hypothetical protein
MIVDNRWQSQFARQLFLALGYRARMAICAMTEKLGRRFATFAGVPYHDPIHLQQWDQLLGNGTAAVRRTRVVTEIAESVSNSGGLPLEARIQGRTRN